MVGAWAAFLGVIPYGAEVGREEKVVFHGGDSLLSYGAPIWWFKAALLGLMKKAAWVLHFRRNLGGLRVIPAAWSLVEMRDAAAARFLVT